MRFFFFAKLSIGLLALFAFVSSASPQDEAQIAYRTLENVPYRSRSENDYANERCRLDLYFPTEKKDFATVVWFHGGGLKQGSKTIPPELKEKGMAVVAVNYRLHPRVQSPVYIDDAAASVAWTMKNIQRYGGNPRKVFVSGHSAGGYLTSMVGLDRSYLKKYGVAADDLAGLIPFSGHTITHFTVRAERGIGDKQPLVDELAPLFHVRKDCPPILLITGDRDLEMLGRYEENAYFWRMLKVVGHQQAELLELDGYNHGGMAGPAHPLLVRFVRRLEKKIR
ncbi:MAG: alpha/beta hydrolase [Planctomycetota bacterium]|nr:alpha/beta hydrolase [Planctomycetota bacterium]